MKMILIRYKAFLLLLTINIIIGLISPEIGIKSFFMTSSNILEMLSVIPPIFILLGLLDVWVDRETMMKYLGKDSGIRGILISFILGSCAAGPLYAAFPVATVMLRKEASIFNIFIFIGAWSTMKIPMLTFEAANLSLPFTITRLALNIIGICFIAFISNRLLSKSDQQNMIELAKK